MSHEPNVGKTSGPERPKYRRIASDALKQILEDHQRWLDSGGEEGARADLTAISIQGSVLRDTNLEEADLSNASLQNVNLDHGKLQRADLRGADLQGASLWSANLRGADPSGADLRRAKLDHAVLSEAKLDGTQLRGATIWGARLEGADLGTAIGLTQAQLDPACGDEGTKLPEGMKVKPCP